MEAKGLSGRRLLIADCHEPWFFKKLNFHQVECAAWWISEHSSVGEQLAFIQCGAGSSPSVPISKVREQLCWIPQSFHFFFPFVKVIGRTARWPPWEQSSSVIPTEYNSVVERHMSWRGRRFDSFYSDFSMMERKSHYSHTLLKRPVEVQGVC